MNTRICPVCGIEIPVSSYITHGRSHVRRNEAIEYSVPYRDSVRGHFKMRTEFKPIKPKQSSSEPHDTIEVKKLIISDPGNNRHTVG